MRSLALVILVSFLAGQPCFALGQSRHFNLDAPGALDALARDKPEHYWKIQEIMAELQKLPDAEVPSWMRARFEARDVKYGPPVLVTYPPKRRLSFTIDDVRYYSTVTLTKWKPS